MAVSFPFKEEKSSIFGVISRPIAEVLFKNIREDVWQPVTMIVDTGADYTLLPKFFASTLSINLMRDCRLITTQGVGGSSKVYLLKRPLQVRIGAFERRVPVGFLSNDYIPPLLGRHEFFETFRVVFDKFSVVFDAPH